MEKTMVKKGAALLLAAALALAAAGCGGAPAGEPSPAPAAPASPKSEAPPIPQGGEGQARQVTDMAGRRAAIPAEIEKVYTAEPVSGIILYTLAPGKLLGWTYPLNDMEKAMILPQYQELTAYGMGDNVNLEAIVAAAPQVCISAKDKLDDNARADADKLQESLGIPVLLVSGLLEDSARVYRFLGEVLGEEEAAEERAKYAEDTLEAVSAVPIPAEERVSVYYGNGADSLETAPKGSVSSEVIDLVGADNVAKLELGEGNRIKVSKEQVIGWNPQVMIINGEPKQDLTGNGAAQAILSDPDFAQVAAVQDARVYGNPKAPFGWVDRPTGPNRLIGIKWLANLVYPGYYRYNIDDEVRGFYRLFYHMELSDEQLASLYRE